MNISKEQILAKLKELDETLIPLQSKISLPILVRICKKMEHNLKFKPIWVSVDNRIVEGHHRYIRSILIGYNLEVIRDYPEPDVSNVHDWNSIDFVKEDWDTISKIRMLNEQDARYNDMSVEEVETIIG